MLEEEEYLRRKEYYQDSGQRHYYFMNIGNGEVIDAARKVRFARGLLSRGVACTSVLLAVCACAWHGEACCGAGWRGRACCWQGEACMGGRGR